MSENIESFVSRLQKEGIDAGREAAESIRAEAQREAERIVEEARSEAATIVEAAKNQAANTLEQARTDLNLAARDVVYRLRETLRHCMNELLLRGANNALRDEDFLKGLIRDVVREYVQADAKTRRTMEVVVSPDMQARLADWAVAELRTSTNQDHPGDLLHGKLKGAGFELKTDGGTIEITPESVLETLAEFVGPRLREIFAQVTLEENRREA